ncbi:cyclase family protein [Mycobacterium avium]|nr:cyclase family protein [Mycobacterium avium]MCG3242813.1 cyclase family protein [Mycobacterium avium subsp. hominissuis]
MPVDTSALPSNWGRWGTTDELGTLNLVTDAVRARAAAEVQTGQSVSLARPIDPAPFAAGPFAPVTSASPAVQQAVMFTGSPPLAMAELLVVTTHHRSLTHLDAVVHKPVDGYVYPGVPLAEAAVPFGVRRGSTSAFAAGILTRGVLLDLAPNTRLPEGHPVTAADFTAAEEREQVRLEPGDALIVRGGWSAASDHDAALPGITLDAVRWMHERDVAAYAGDIGDGHPPVDPEVTSPLHGVALARLGMPLIDVAEVDELATRCAALGRFAFLLSAAPPRIGSLTGVPVNPIAIF